MKKSISVLLTGAFVLSMSAGAFAQSATSIPATPITQGATVTAPQAPQVSLFQGKIVKVTQDKGVTSLEVKANDQDETMIFHLSEDTYLIDANTGFKMSIDARTNDNVSIYYGPAVTMSLPAQSTATAVIGNMTKESTALNYAKVEAVTKNADGSIVVTTDGGSRLVTLGKDMPIVPFMTKNIVTLADVQVGSELLLAYDIMAMSMPAQANALSAVVLSTPIADETEKDPSAPVTNGDKMIISTSAGVISVNQAEINTEAGDLFYTNANGDVMVPVRVIAEKLGYEVLWMAGSDNITLKKDAKTATFTVGDINYGANKMRVQLKSAPEVRNNTTYVPTDFFAQALEVEVVINNSHV